MTCSLIGLFKEQPKFSQNPLPRRTFFKPFIKVEKRRFLNKLWPSNATLENQITNIGIQKEITDFYSTLFETPPTQTQKIQNSRRTKPTDQIYSQTTLSNCYQRCYHPNQTSFQPLHSNTRNTKTMEKSIQFYYSRKETQRK
jgi:hypothetical protein